MYSIYTACAVRYRLYTYNILEFRNQLYLLQMLPAFFSRRKPVFGGYYWRRNNSPNLDDQQQTHNGAEVEADTASTSLQNPPISPEQGNTAMVGDDGDQQLSADEAFTEEVYQNAINSILSNDEYNDNDQDYDIVEKRDYEDKQAEEIQNAGTEEESSHLQYVPHDSEDGCSLATRNAEEDDDRQPNTAIPPASVVDDAEVTSIPEKDSAEPITFTSPTLPSAISEVDSNPSKSTKTGAKKQKQKKKKSTRAD